MKKTILLLAGMALSLVSFSQTEFNSEVEYYQSAYGLEKKAIVENFVELTNENSGAFWETYNAYESERKTIGKTRIDNLSTYADIFDEMTDDQANDITTKMLSNRLAQEKLYKKYFGKMKKVVGAKTALQFLELEVYLQTAISFAILESIPFIGE